ncbi:hypothetical protein [Sphingomonas sp. Leaf343]|uniref:hypothetical protein n=1 Tax=Sphingomonas sp. Leaf343 TaxID=1736345 RepID=UPI0007007BE8|nr:hypothetical protein [Sphingomonas sp. Leaf343]KQR81189.1 hypothetical protein ASG07_12020 [Sphingomonas sp. Leaf343]
MLTAEITQFAMRRDDAVTLAAALIAQVGAPAAIGWLEDRLVACDTEEEARACCSIIEAVEASVRRRLH